MIRRTPSHDWQLTDAELEIAKGVKDLPASLTEQLAQGGQALPVRTAALRKVRLAMAEERLLREEVAKYEGYEHLAAEAEAARATATGLRDELAAAHREIARLRRELGQRTAQPALASHADPTGR